jgi:bifunctional DNA-binding transcriptional regulator/antitoxin component of YhaV-PrlF toxin-antitoxin module
MGFPTKVQLIKRKLSEQWYINFPSAVAQAMEFKRGEVVEWIVEDKTQLVLNRLEPPPSALKKKRQRSAKSSTNSGRDAAEPSNSRERS